MKERSGKIGIKWIRVTCGVAGRKGARKMKNS